MTFLNIVLAEMNANNPERVREGKPATADSLSAVEIAICTAFDKFKFCKPAESGFPIEAIHTGKRPRLEPLELEPTDPAEVLELMR